MRREVVVGGWWERRRDRLGLFFFHTVVSALSHMTDYLAVDDCEPAVFFLLHVSKCCCNFLEVSLGGVVAVQDSLFVIALDRPVCPEAAPL